MAPGDGAEAIDATPSTRVNLLGGGYGKSKWVAEHRLARAAADGRLRALGVARLGLLGPHSSSGAANHNDWLHLFLRAVAASRAVPAIAGAEHAAAIALLPVDLAAAAVVKLAKAVADSEGGRGRDATTRVSVANMDARAFGVPPTPVATLLSHLEAALGTAGTLERVVPYSEWRQRVRELGGESEAALAVLPPVTPNVDSLRMPTAGRSALERRAAAKLCKGSEECLGALAYPYTAATWRAWAQRVVCRQHQLAG